jgi:hypothetical protein
LSKKNFDPRGKGIEIFGRYKRILLAFQFQSIIDLDNEQANFWK